MSKDWTFVGSNAVTFGEKQWTREYRFKKHRKFNNVIHNLKVRSEKEMKKDSEKAYDAAVAYKEQLLSAYDIKKLKSKKLIKEARSLKDKKNAEDAFKAAAT